MRTLKIASLILAAATLAACTKEINRDLPSHECSILELQIEGQLGRAEITRVDDKSGTVSVYVMDNPQFPWSEVKLNALAISSYASADVKEGDLLDFYNPEHRARINVTSQTGKKVAWTIYIKSYDAFYVGTWAVEDVRLYVDQNISGCGTGKWDISVNGTEFGYYASYEMDNIITITMNEGVTDDGRFTGKIINDAGEDGQYADFWGVYQGEYTTDEPLDMNPRLRHLLPAGESDWSLNLNTNEMSITQRNITSVMTFRNEGSSVWFDFALPNAAGDIGGSNFYDNYWRSSYQFSYNVKPMR
ncbi:MAG: hypothetical protein J1E04_01450 [Alistipes sp.]|nr:hypothetical protein [Alistipes sp.]